MNIKGESNPMKNVRVSVWNNKPGGVRTKDGRKSVTFTVENATIEEVVSVCKKAIRDRGA